MGLEREIGGVARAVRAGDDHRAFGVRAELGRRIRQHDLFRQGGVGHGAKHGPARPVLAIASRHSRALRSLTGRGPPPIIEPKDDGRIRRVAGKGAATRPEKAGPPRNLDAARLLGLYRDMLRIRAFEEAALKGLEQKLVLGAIHPSIGQEAVAVGVCRNLEPSDILLSTHRGHGHTIAKGADTLAMMRELFGREGGTCHGKGGSMHIADFKVGMLGANGVVGANIVIAVGAAHAVRLKKGREVVTCIFGDGAINRGPVPGGLELGRRVEAADPVRVRGQRLCRHHAHAGDDVGRGPGGAGRELRHSGGDRRRQRPAGGGRDRAPAAGGDPRRRRAALPAVQDLSPHRTHRRRRRRLSQQGRGRDRLEERPGGAYARSIGDRRRRGWTTSARRRRARGRRSTRHSRRPRPRPIRR